MIASLAAWLIMDSKGRVDHESGLVTGR
jgi:hypothetical protein